MDNLFTSGREMSNLLVMLDTLLLVFDFLEVTFSQARNLVFLVRRRKVCFDDYQKYFAIGDGIGYLLGHLLLLNG
jgi:hypothetical protein